MPAAKNAEVTLTNDDRVRNVIHNFNTDGIDSLHPNYSGSRPKAFTLPKRREIKKTAKSNHLPSSTWNLTQPADFLDAEGVVDDINHEGLRILLREEGVSFPRLKTWKTSRAPDYAAKKSRFELLRASLRDRRRRGQFPRGTCCGHQGKRCLMRHWLVDHQAAGEVEFRCRHRSGPVGRGEDGGVGDIVVMWAFR